MTRKYVVCYYAGHDASLAIVGDGKIFHFPRERFSRIKHDSGDMKPFMDACYKSAKISPDEIFAAAGVGGGDIYSSMRTRGNWSNLMEVDTSSTSYFGPSVPVYWIPHHTAHAAYAFYTSVFESARLLAIDAGGDSENNVTVCAATGNAKHVFGEPEGEFSLVSTRDEDGVTIGATWAGRAIDFCKNKWAAGTVMAMVGIPRDKFVEYTGFTVEQYDSIQKLQKVTNITFARLVGKTTNVVAAGGCALNGIAMYDLLKTKLVDHIHVPPAVHDEGLTVGACLYVLHKVLKTPRVYYDPMVVAFNGFTDAKLDIPVDAPSIAKKLADGEIVALAYGQAESGPRALGHRSILADPRKLEMKDRINILKGRQAYRPVAPVVLSEFANEYFKLIDSHCYDFMTTIADTTEKAKKEIPAGIHYDGSARVQVVDSDHILGEIITEFAKLTNVPVILNTSLNRKDEAICNSWEHVEQTVGAMGISLAPRIA